MRQRLDEYIKEEPVSIISCLQETHFKYYNRGKFSKIMERFNMYVIIKKSRSIYIKIKIKSEENYHKEGYYIIIKVQ